MSKKIAGATFIRVQKKKKQKEQEIDQIPEEEKLKWVELA